MSDWKQLPAPGDGKFRLYGLTVNHKESDQFFECYYLAIDEGGDLVHPSGDVFDDWSLNDFEVWADAPQPYDPEAR